MTQVEKLCEIRVGKEEKAEDELCTMLLFQPLTDGYLNSWHFIQLVYVHFHFNHFCKNDFNFRIQSPSGRKYVETPAGRVA